MTPLLSIRDLSVVYQGETPVSAVTNVSLDIRPGEIFGLAGESGCGKSTLAYAVTKLLPAQATIPNGSIEWTPESAAAPLDVLALEGPALRAFRWSEISMVFQGAMNALNPVLRIGRQIEDVLIDHPSGYSRAQRRQRAGDLLERVSIDRNRLRSYPHELSGGMRQRVMIAMALALEPQLIVMDEPTTALDVVVQRKILGQINELREEFGFAVLFITHDLALLLEISDRIGIMLGGRIVEENTPDALRADPQHSYTRHLLSSFPSIRGTKTRGNAHYVQQEEA